MKIVIVGVPKVGKTKLAKKLRSETAMPVIDNVAQKFSRRTGLVIGPNADYRVNIALAAERWQLDTINPHCIMTSSILDSIFYASVGIKEFELSDTMRYTGFDQLFVQPYYFTSVYLINFFRNSWKVDKVLYLPYTGKDEDWLDRDRVYPKILNDLEIEHEIVNV